MTDAAQIGSGNFAKSNAHTALGRLLSVQYDRSRTQKSPTTASQLENTSAHQGGPRTRTDVAGRVNRDCDRRRSRGARRAARCTRAGRGGKLTITAGRSSQFKAFQQDGLTAIYIIGSAPLFRQHCAITRYYGRADPLRDGENTPAECFCLETEVSANVCI